MVDGIRCQSGLNIVRDSEATCGSVPQLHCSETIRVLYQCPSRVLLRFDKYKLFTVAMWAWFLIIATSSYLLPVLTYHLMWTVYLCSFWYTLCDNTQFLQLSVFWEKLHVVVLCWPSSPCQCRVAICRSTAGDLFSYNRHCLSSVMFPVHLSFTDKIYTTICRFYTLLIDLSWVFYLHIVLSSGPFPTPGNVTVLSADLSAWRQSASESRSPRYFVEVLFCSICLLPDLGSFRDHLAHN